VLLAGTDPANDSTITSQQDPRSIWSAEQLPTKYASHVMQK